jgi:hypothetical protein
MILKYSIIVRLFFFFYFEFFLAKPLAYLLNVFYLEPEIKTNVTAVPRSSSG